MLCIAGWCMSAALTLAQHSAASHRALSSWTLDPLVLTLLAISSVLYLRGARKLRGLRWWNIASFHGGLFTIFIAQISPLDSASDILFSAHMGQHELLILVAAPLVVFGRPLTPILRGLPVRMHESSVALMRRDSSVRLWRMLTRPLNVFVLHAVVILGWHIPLFYETAIQHEALHFIQHSTFLMTAVLFWWAIVHGRYGRMGYGMAVLFVFATALYNGALGALITFAPRLWYPLYDSRTRAVELDPLVDQQLAGMIMWIPAGALLTVLALALFAAWLGSMERRMPEWRRS